MIYSWSTTVVCRQSYTGASSENIPHKKNEMNSYTRVWCEAWDGFESWLLHKSWMKSSSWIPMLPPTQEFYTLFLQLQSLPISCWKTGGLSHSISGWKLTLFFFSGITSNFIHRTGQWSLWLRCLWHRHFNSSRKHLWSRISINHQIHCFWRWRHRHSQCRHQHRWHLASHVFHEDISACMGGIAFTGNAGSFTTGGDDKAFAMASNARALEWLLAALCKFGVGTFGVFFAAGGPMAGGLALVA